MQLRNSKAIGNIGRTTNSSSSNNNSNNKGGAATHSDSKAGDITIGIRVADKWGQVK